MQTLNHTLDKNILNADGCYLDDQQLHSLESYVQSYATRLSAYQHLRDSSEKIVMMALRKLAQVYPDLLQQHGARCKYDMTEMLRYLALSVLRDDERLFKEQALVWLDTVLLAYKQNDHCSQGYQNLQAAIAASLPTAEIQLVRPYLELIVQTLSSHA
jgi:hypothetical protein